MKWVDKLERRFGRIAIHDLMMAIVIGQAVVFLAEFFMPGPVSYTHLSFAKKGQAVVEMNWKAIDAGFDAYHKVEVPASWKDAQDVYKRQAPGPAF